MNQIWIGLDGRPTDPEAPGAFPVFDGGLAVEEQDDLWVGDFYSKEIAKAEAERESLVSQHNKRLARLKARVAYLDYAYLDRVRASALRMIASEGKGKKSYEFLYGTAKFTASRATEVYDREAALNWARVNAPEAIKLKLAVTDPAAAIAWLEVEEPSFVEVEEDLLVSVLPGKRGVLTPATDTEAAVLVPGVRPVDSENFSVKPPARKK